MRTRFWRTHWLGCRSWSPTKWTQASAPLPTPTRRTRRSCACVTLRRSAGSISKSRCASKPCYQVGTSSPSKHPTWSHSTMRTCIPTVPKWTLPLPTIVLETRPQFSGASYQTHQPKCHTSCQWNPQWKRSNPLSSQRWWTRPKTHSQCHQSTMWSMGVVGKIPRIPQTGRLENSRRETKPSVGWANLTTWARRTQTWLGTMARRKNARRIKKNPCARVLRKTSMWLRKRMQLRLSRPHPIKFLSRMNKLRMTYLSSRSTQCRHIRDVPKALITLHLHRRREGLPIVWIIILRIEIRLRLKTTCRCKWKSWKTELVAIYRQTTMRWTTHPGSTVRVQPLASHPRSHLTGINAVKCRTWFATRPWTRTRTCQELTAELTWSANSTRIGRWDSV